MRLTAKGLGMIIIGTELLERHGESGSRLKAHIGVRFSHLIIVVEVTGGVIVVSYVVAEGGGASITEDRLAMPLLTIFTVV